MQGGVLPARIGDGQQGQVAPQGCLALLGDIFWLQGFAQMFIIQNDIQVAAIFGAGVLNFLRPIFLGA